MRTRADTAEMTTSLACEHHCHVRAARSSSPTSGICRYRILLKPNGLRTQSIQGIGKGGRDEKLRSRGARYDNLARLRAPLSRAPSRSLNPTSGICRNGTGGRWGGREPTAFRSNSIPAVDRIVSNRGTPGLRTWESRDALVLQPRANPLWLQRLSSS